MAIKVITEFLQNATIRIRAYFYDDDDALVDPTQRLIELWDAEGEKLQNNTAMAYVSKGIYEHYEYTDTDSPEGHWRGVVWAVDGSGDLAKYSEGSFGFRLKK